MDKWDQAKPKSDAIDPQAWCAGKWLLNTEPHYLKKRMIIAIVDQQIRIMMRAGK